MKMMIGTIAGTMRIPFLILAPVSALAGYAAARFDGIGDTIDPVRLLAVFAGALLAHVAVNVLNEYFDFRSGLDALTVRTPLSGGSGFLQRHPVYAPMALRFAIACSAAVLLIGTWFTVSVGPVIVPFIATGLLIVLSYTPFLVRIPSVCLVAPGLGFGTVMVNGVCVALTGRFSASAGVVSLVLFFLVSNLLLLNQFPDIEADRTAGRRNVLIRYGRKTGAVLFSLFAGGAFCTIVAGVIGGILPGTALTGLIPVSLGAVAAYGAFRFAASTRKLIPYLGINVATAAGTPLVLAICLITA